MRARAWRASGDAMLALPLLATPGHAADPIKIGMIAKFRRLPAIESSDASLRGKGVNIDRRAGQARRQRYVIRNNRNLPILTFNGRNRIQLFME